jgi:type II secretory pathway component PulK
MRHYRRRGISLVRVFSVMAALSVGVVAIVDYVCRDIRVAHDNVERARARTVADAAVNFAVLGVLYPSHGRRLWVDGIEHETTFDGAALRIRLDGADRSMGLNVFSVTAEARLPSGGIFVRKAIVSLTGDPNAPYRFLSWEESSAPAQRSAAATGS